MKANMACFVSFVIDTETHKSAITFVQASPSGSLNILKQIKGEEAENIYALMAPINKLLGDDENE